jgi:hypothetical protein
MLLGTSITLPNGLRVRLRLPQGGDRPGLLALHAAAGLELDDMALRRLMRVDPRRRAAICAAAWTGAGEQIVGFAAADLGSEPDVIVSDEDTAPGLCAILAAALAERGALVRDVA